MAKKSKDARVGSHGPGTPATTALDAAGVAYTARAYVHDPSSSSYGLEAAQALGVDPERVFKTLMVEIPAGASSQLCVAVVPVAGSLDLKAAAAAFGVKKAAMADLAAAERRSGYVRGGISPLGQRLPSPTAVDISALDHETVLVSGGRRGFDIELAPKDLVRLTDAIVAPLRAVG
ncbi:Cys-tRNA(Pro) deacylase [Sinomonas notoginsengisoli]|uniref:Cys-tRNA(Pro) deacylase n=1 Tax=Sinomonas notoginsengisoli TaxID=1457311 RepID=UPI001F22A458|nr:Cys-tRNA(Pro) deacylase [Sinomonas notoginsengisoli]